jgi:hypothetical protein
MYGGVLPPTRIRPKPYAFPAAGGFDHGGHDSNLDDDSIREKRNID